MTSNDCSFTTLSALVDHLEKTKVAKSKPVSEALRAVDRKLFCASNPYHNSFQFNQNGAIVDQPSKIAEILELFEDKLKLGAKCLVIGSENGYIPILIAKMIGTGLVVGMEYRKQLRDESHVILALLKKSLQLARVEFVDVKNDDWTWGNELFSPYNVVYCSYIAAKIPQRVVNQLAIGGRLIMPINNDDNYSWRCIDKTDDGDIVKRTVEVQSEKRSDLSYNREDPDQFVLEKVSKLTINVPNRSAISKVIGDYHYVESKESLLGKGSFGHVWRCTRVSNGSEAAVKVVCDTGEDFKNEIAIMRTLKSPYLLQLRDFKVWLKMAEAYAVLYSNAVLHRDIKPSNILISNSSGEDFHAKLGDFGIGKVLGDQCEYANTAVGTLFYMAPEIGASLKRRRIYSHYDSRADVWSFGLVFHECFTGERLMTEEMMENLCEMANKKDFWLKDLSPPLNAPPDFCNLVQRMLVIDYRNRLTTTEFLQHPYVK